MLSAQSALNHSGLFQPWQASVSTFSAGGQQRADFVELPPVSDFHELSAHEDFRAIQTQFLSEVRELKQLAQAYVSHKYDNAIDTFLTKLETPTDDLLACLLPLYRETRFQIHRLVEQLKGRRQAPGDDHNQQNSGVGGYIASVLHDCLDGMDLCPAGIHSRFARSFLDLEAILNGGLIGRLYKQRNDVFCEFIQAFLWQNQREGKISVAAGMEVHWFNALYNLYCDNLALMPVDDPQATTNLSDELLYCFLQSAPVLVNACVILRRIADSWCEKLTTTLASVGCCHWLTGLTRSDENTAIGVNALISEVFNPINCLMGTTTDNPLNLAAVMDLCGDENFHLKRHREKILAWLAGYFYRGSVTVFAEIAVRRLAATYIGSINELFFWVFDHDQVLRPGQPCCFTPDQHTSLKLPHLLSIDFSSWSADASHALLTQAMEQTDDPGEIAEFFLNSRVNIQLAAVSRSVRQVLSHQLCGKLLRHTSAFKEALCRSVCNYFPSSGRTASDFSLGWLINTPLLEPVLTGLSRRNCGIYRVTRSLNTWQIADWPQHRLKELLLPADCRRLFKQAFQLCQVRTLGCLLLTGHCDEEAFSSSDHLFNERRSDPPRTEPLLNLFARHGDLAGVKYLLSLARQYALTRAESYQAQAAVINQRCKHGSTPLLTAARYGHAECLQLLVNIPGVEVNVRNEVGHTPLHLAAEYGRLSCVRVLLETGVRLNGRTFGGMTPLNSAVTHGHLDVVRTLLAQTCIDVNQACQRGVSPLLQAARGGHLEILRLLLATPGIEVNAKDVFGWTALNSAATGGHLQCVEALLQAAGIRVNEPCDNGWAPLNGSAHRGHCEVLRVLLQAPDIDVNAKSHDGWTPLNSAASEGFANCVQALLQAPGVEVNAFNSFGSSPLCSAAQGGRFDCVRLLLEAPGIDVNHLCDRGLAPLSYAALFGHLEIVRAILTAPGVLVNISGNRATALFYAARFDHADIVRELLQVPGISVNARNDKGFTPLITAAEKGHLECVRELIAADGIDVNQPNDVGWTPLNAAARYGQLQCVEELLQAPGIEVNKPDSFGWTPLHHATDWGHWGCVRALSQAADIDVKQLTSKGDFALRIATKNGDAQCLQVLLATPGIEVNQMGQDGQFALGTAAERGDLRCLQVLLAKPGVQVNMIGRHGASALHLAASNGHPQCIRALLQVRGIDLKKRDHFNLTPLDTAMRLPSRECSVLLLQALTQEKRKRTLSRDPPPPAKVPRHDL